MTQPTVSNLSQLISMLQQLGASLSMFVRHTLVLCENG